MATIVDVAKLAGVSPASVSHVMNGNYTQVSAATRERILAAAKQLNYRPNNIARSLRNAKSNTVAIIVEDLSVLNVGSIIDGIHEYANRMGYSVQLCNLRLLTRTLSTPDPYVELFNDQLMFNNHREEFIRVIEKDVAREVDGIVYTSTHKRDVSGLITGFDKPIVYCGCYGGNRAFNTVINNDFGASEQVVSHLIANGHRNIAVITGSTFSVVSNERLEGFKRAMAVNGCPVRNEYIRFGDWMARTGFMQMQALMQLRTRPTAVFCFNDVMAGGALYYCQKNKINVPHDVSIVGFDNRDISWITYPRLTTVGVPTLDMGRTAGKMLIDAIESKSEIPSIKLPCDLIERDSVRDLNADVMKR